MAEQTRIINGDLHLGGEGTSGKVYIGGPMSPSQDIFVGGPTNKVGFYGKAPVAQSASADQVAPAAYVTGAFGLNSDANAEALYDLVVAMRTTLVDAGLMKGAA